MTRRASSVRTGGSAFGALGRSATIAAVVIVASAVASISPAVVGATAERTPAEADSLAASRTVERFHRALSAGDSATVLHLLAPEATILESGDTESLAEYRAHHLPADIEFARAVRETRSAVRVTVHGDAAWAIATSTARGTFRGRAIDSAGAELMILTRAAGGWRIAAIHWSSRRRN